MWVELASAIWDACADLEIEKRSILLIDQIRRLSFKDSVVGWS